MRSITTTFLAFLLAASAQQPGPQTGGNTPDAPKGSARFGATTQLVVEDVIVKGKDGNPITGLQPADFIVTEDGKPQKISVFEFQKLEEQPAPAVSPSAVETAPN